MCRKPDARGPVRLRRHADGAALLDSAARWLADTEIENNQIIGIADRLRDAAPDEPTPYLATVEDAAGETIGAVLRTPPFVAVVTSLPEAAWELVVEDLWRADPGLPGVFGPAEAVDRFAALWTARTGTRVVPDAELQEYVLEEVSPCAAPGGMRAPTADEHALALEWTARFAEDLELTEGEGLAALMRRALAADGLRLWDDDGPVSMAAAAGETPSGARIALVYTPPDLRCRGYAAACVAALCAERLAAGKRYCFLNADAANPASNAAYRNVGFRPGPVRQEIRFTRPT